MASKTPGPVTPRSGVPVTPRSGVPVTPQRSPSAKKKRMAEDKAENYYRVGLVGSGNMARAIVEGLLASGMGGSAGVVVCSELWDQLKNAM